MCNCPDSDLMCSPWAPSMLGLGTWDLGFGTWDLGLRTWDLGFGILIALEAPSGAVCESSNDQLLI